MNPWDAWTGLALPLFALVLLAVAGRGGPGAAHARVAREGGTVFLGERIMQRGYRWIDALAGTLARAGVSADAVSWASLALGAVAGVLAGSGQLGLAAWMLALSGCCDGLDGALAQRHGTAGTRGAVLDSALDRYVEFFFVAGLLVYLRGEWLLQLVAITALFGGFMVTYSTAKAEALHVTPPRGWMKRPERLVWLVGGAAFAATARLVDVSPPLVIASVLGVIAVFAHASAIVRLKAIATAAPRPRT